MSTLGQVGWVARRSVRRTLRQPALIMPTIVFPLVLLGINAGGLKAATEIPGFPGDSYLSFALATTFMQGALFSATTSGTELASDIETGFLNRLALTPLRGVAVLIGQLAGAVTVSMLSAVTYLLVGLVAGVEIAAGFGGALAVLALAALIGIAFGALGSLMGVRTGSQEAVQGLFPLMFVFFFLSSINLPRNLIAIDWFRTVADANPVSYLVEGLRSPIITGWDGTALWRAVAVAVALATISFALAARSMSTRLART